MRSSSWFVDGCLFIVSSYGIFSLHAWGEKNLCVSSYSYKDTIARKVLVLFHEKEFKSKTNSRQRSGGGECGLKGGGGETGMEESAFLQFFLSWLVINFFFLPGGRAQENVRLKQPHCHLPVGVELCFPLFLSHMLFLELSWSQVRDGSCRIFNADEIIII